MALDVGSHHIWMSRYFAADHARQVLVSNGQQTLGVALPWAMSANLLRPGQPVISVSGDDGFLFTATELETAKRLGSRFAHQHGGVPGAGSLRTQCWCQAGPL